MEKPIIIVMFKDYSSIAEEVKRKMKNPDKPKESGETVSIHQFDMLSQSYEEKFAECEILKAENRKLTAELSKYRYFIECQKNEIEKL